MIDPPSESPYPKRKGWGEVCEYVMDNIREGTIITDYQGYIVRANRSVCEWLGYHSYQLVGRRAIDLAAVGDRKRLANEFNRLHDGVDILTVTTVITNDGYEIPVELAGRGVDVGEPGNTLFVATLQDLRSRRVEDQAQIRRREQQRRAVVREVHHRVKNHLQGLVGLIHREAERYPQGANIFRDISTKIKAISVMHGLQASQETDALSLCEVSLSVATLNEQVWGQAGSIKTSIEIDCPALIKEAESVPVALLLNEIIGNAIKHSPVTHNGVHITISGDGRLGQAEVTISNEGRLPERFEQAMIASTGSGLGLVRSLLPPEGADFSIGNDESSGSVITKLSFFPPVIIRRNT